MQEDDLVTPVPQMLERLQKFRHVTEAVAQEDHQPARGQLLGDPMPQRGEGRLAAGPGSLERLEDQEEVFRRGARPDHTAELRVVESQAHGVALVEHEVRQRGGDVLGERELGRVRAGVAHAAGRIDDEGGAEVRLLLELLDVVAIRLADRPPVDVADLVAGVVLAMLGELDRVALERTFVNATQEALDEAARHEGEGAVFRQAGGVE